MEPSAILAPAPTERPLHVVARFRPEDDYRPVVKVVVAAAATLTPPLRQGRLHDLRLAVTEACSNAAKVHRADAVGKRIVVRCEIGADRCVRVDVRDWGPGFDPNAVPELPDPSDPERLQHESGLGVHLIHELADAVSIRHLDDGTVFSIFMGAPESRTGTPVRHLAAAS